MKINCKLLAWLLGGLLTAAGLIFAVHCLQHQRIARALLFQANRAEEQGDTPRLVSYLKRYLELNPRDLDEKARLARALTSDYPGASARGRLSALYLLESVVAIDPDRAELRRLLIKTALGLGRPKTARDHLDALWKDAADQLEPTERGELEGYWGQLAEIEKDFPQAMRWYRQACSHNPHEQSSFLRLAYLLRTQPANTRKPEESQAEADQFIDRLVQANEGLPAVYLARWNYRQQFDLVRVEKGADGPPGGPCTPACKQACLLAVGPPGASPPHTARALVKGTTIDAGADVARALQLAPEKVEVLLAAGHLARLLQQRDEARKHLEQGLELLARPAGLGSDFLRPQLLWHLTSLLLDGFFDDKLSPEMQTSNAAEIVQRINQVRRYRGQEASADFLEGRLRLIERRWSEAVALFERARQVFGKQGEHHALLIPIDVYLGQCYEQLEEPGAMYTAFRRAAESDPSNAQALLGMAGAQWLQGRLDEAMSDCRKAMDADQRRGAATPISLRGWSDIARLAIQRQLQREPERRDWSELEQALQRAASVKGKPEATYELTLLRAELLAAQQKYQQAEELLVAATESAAKDPESATSSPNRLAGLWAARARLLLRSKEPKKAEALLEEAQKTLGQPIEIRLAWAQLWELAPVSRGRQSPEPGSGRQSPEQPPPPDGGGSPDSAVKEATLKLRQLQEGIKELKLADQGRLLDALAEAHFRLGNNDEGAALCRELAQHPDHQSDLRLRLLLFDLALQKGDGPGMEKALEEIRNVERTNGPFCRCGQALRLLLLARNGQKDRQEAIREAQSDLDRAARLRPNWAQVNLARAQIHEMQGNTEGVIKELRQAVQLGDSSPAVIRRLVVALHEKHRYQEADEELHKLRSSLLVQSELGRLAASCALQKGDPARALQLARDAVSADSKDFREQLWFGRMYQATSDPAETERRIRQAVSLAPTEPIPYVSLVRFLAERQRAGSVSDGNRPVANASGSLAQARQVIQEMKARVDPEQRTFAEALCEEALGQWQQARAAFEQALADQPGNFAFRRAFVGFELRTGQLRSAEKLLREALSKASEPARPASEERDWARRSLAVLLADGTDFARFHETLELVGARLDANGYPVREKEPIADPELIRAQARVLATQTQRHYRERTLELFEQLSRNQDLTPEDQFVQALLLESAGNLVKTRERLQALCLDGRSGSAPLPHYLIFLTRSLIRAREHQQAERWIERLETMEKERGVPTGSLATVELRARLLEARGEGQKALELLQQHSKRPGAPPEEVLMLLGSLVNQQRYDEVFALLDQVWRACRPETAGAVSVSLLRQMKPSEQQVQAVEERLRQAIGKEPRRMVFRLQLAELYDQRGRYPQAIEQLSEVVKDQNEPHNVVALNSLAWLLAHQAEAGADSQARALELIDKAIRGFGKRAELLDTRGVVFLSLGKPEQALADLKEAAGDAPTPARLFHLARAHYQGKDRENAARALRKARELGLTPEKLHPAEQALAQRLLAELKVQ